MNISVTIASRFHGPPHSGNGGYSCGLLARHVAGPAAVRLHIPPPLDKVLVLRQRADDMALFDDETLVATARPTTLEMEIPTAPGFVEAVAASDRYRGFKSHFYPGCFVCGPDREAGDGMRIFAGPLNSSSGPDGMVAAAWVPDASLADSTGRLAPEFIWAALDCPGAYAFPEPSKGAILLGELAVSIKRPVNTGERCVLTGWETGRDGRKHFTGTALFDNDGRCAAFARATWFEVPSTPA